MIDLKQASINVIKTNQAESGAYVASPTFSQYGYSWLRDGMWIAYSMDCVGEHASATAFHRWVAKTLLRYETQVALVIDKIDQGIELTEADYLPTRFTVDSDLGEEDWPNFQLDGYGAWLWGAVDHCTHHNPQLWAEIRPAIVLTVSYLTALWQSPNYDCWEEFRTEIHIATLGALYGGLQAVMHYDNTIVSPDIVDNIKQYILKNGVADDGHFMKFIDNANVDSSLLWLAVPFGVFDVNDNHFQKTLAKIENDIQSSDGGVYRYQKDTYFGGGEWLLLTCWLAWVYLKLDRVADAHRLITWVEAQATANGDMPEQVANNLLDASYYQGWVDQWGESACPLLWSHAMYLIVVTAMENKAI